MTADPADFVKKKYIYNTSGSAHRWLLTKMFKKKEPVAAHPEFGQVRMKPGLGEGQASAQGVETAIADCIAGCEETESDRNIGFLV